MATPVILGAHRKWSKKISILSKKTWGDRFYQPLQMGHQNVPAPVVPTNFSILACTVVGTF